MVAPYTPTPPDEQQVAVDLVGSGVRLNRWTRYTFASNFLTPSDGWSFSVGDDYLDEDVAAALRVGERVKLSVDGRPLATGAIDAVTIDADAQQGTVYTIEGRDRLGAAVDAIADPRMQFKDGATLADFLKQLFGPLGWSSDEQFSISNQANRDAKTGGLRDAKTTRADGSQRGAQALARIKLHVLKPHNHEGLFQFAQRVTDRFGLWIWTSADGETLIIGSPDFYQEPKYQLRRKYDGLSGHANGTNILRGSVRYDATDQPSVIIADGRSGGGEFGHSSMVCYCINPYFGFEGDSRFVPDVTAATLAKYPDADQVTFVTQPFKNRAPSVLPRPLFMHDEDSKTPDQLAFYVKRMMGDFMRRSLVCKYTVEGHGQTVNGVFVPWDVDTVVDVQDEIGGVSERMYVLGRSFEKSRSGGTFTHLELVRLGSIVSSDQGDAAGKGKR